MIKYYLCASFVLVVELLFNNLTKYAYQEAY